MNAEQALVFYRHASCSYLSSDVHASFVYRCSSFEDTMIIVIVIIGDGGGRATKPGTIISSLIFAPSIIMISETIKIL